MFVSIVESFVLCKTIIVRPRDKPWMSNEIRRSIRKRNRLLKIYSRTKSMHSWERYRVQRNLVVSLIRVAKRNYDIKLNQILCDPQTSAKKWWGLVKSAYGNKYHTVIPAILDGDILISEPKEKADLFNNYFASQSCIPNSETAEVPFLVPYSPHFMASISADEELVYNLLSTVVVAKACGCDGIRNKMIKLCSAGLCKVFTRLINLSISLGQFPSAWKFANVLPLFKKDNRQLKSNYIDLFHYYLACLKYARRLFLFICIIFLSKLVSSINFNPVFVQAIQP